MTKKIARTIVKPDEVDRIEAFIVGLSGVLRGKWQGFERLLACVSPAEFETYLGTV